MKHLNVYLMIIVVLLIGLSGLVTSAHAASQATYDLVQSYIGPSGNGNAGIYSLSNSIGQPAVGEVSAGIYTFGGGFWGGGVIVPAIGNYKVYLPLVLK